MICKNLTVGTRHDYSTIQEFKNSCAIIKTSLSTYLANKFHQNEVEIMAATAFSEPHIRKRLEADSTSVSSLEEASKEPQEGLEAKESSESLGLSKKRQQASERANFEHLPVEESKKALKVIERLTTVEELMSIEGVVSAEKLNTLRRVNRELLSNCASSSGDSSFKYTHLDSIVGSIALTSASLLNLSIKKVFSILQRNFAKKISIANIRKSKGYQLMKKAKIYSWDVY